MIQPTIGRIVWYRPSDFDHNVMTIHDAQPLAATVAYVYSDTMVNLAVSDHLGNTYGRTSVILLQDGQATPSGAYCEWMPFQKGQAAKTEALEKRIDPGAAA
jgi:hypothetical protein